MHPNSWTDGRMDGQTHGQTDRPSYRDAWTHLKKRRKKEKVWQKKNRERKKIAQ